MGVKFLNFHFLKKVMLNNKGGKYEWKKIFKKTW
jgi:hypothetical protein